MCFFSVQLFSVSLYVFYLSLLVSLSRRYNVEASLKDTIKRFLEEEKIYTSDLIDAAISSFDPQQSVSDFLSVSQNEHVLKGVFTICLSFVSSLGFDSNSWFTLIFFHEAMGFPNLKSFFTLLDEAKQSKEVIQTKRVTLGLDGEFVLALVTCNDSLS